MPQFQKDNTSGKGPPKGSRNLSTLIREHLRHDAPERAATIVESALDKQRMEGVRALRQLSPRPSGEIVEINLSAEARRLLRGCATPLLREG